MFDAAPVLTVPAEQREVAAARRLARHAGRDRARARAVALAGAHPARPEAHAQVLPAVAHGAVRVRVQVLEHLAAQSVRQPQLLATAVGQSQLVEPQAAQAGRHAAQRAQVAVFPHLPVEGRSALSRGAQRSSSCDSATSVDWHRG